MSNSPDHTSRDHAEFSPSSLKYVAGCAGYDGREGTSAAAEKGTRIHEALEVRDPSALHDDEELSIYEQIVSDEESFTENFFGDEPYEELNEIQVTVELDGTETWGTCDRLLLAGNKALMADYKTGISVIDSPRDNWQAKAYVLGAFQKYPDIENLTFVFYVPVREQVLHDDFTREDVPTLTAELSKVIRRGEKVRPMWGDGEYPDMELLSPTVNCRFCKHEDHCPALGGVAVEVASRVSMLPAIDITDPDDPEVVEQLWAVAKIVSNWASRIKTKAIDMAKDGTEFSTLRLRSMGSTRKCTDNKKLMEVAEDFDLSQEDVLSLANIPLAKLAALAGDRAPEGEKGQTSNDFLAATEDADIVAVSARRYTLSETK